MVEVFVGGTVIVVVVITTVIVVVVITRLFSNVSLRIGFTVTHFDSF